MLKTKAKATFCAALLAASGAAAAQSAPPAGAPPLSYETLVSDGLVRASAAKLPSGEAIASSPITSVLVYGKTDALLIDPPLSLEQTRQVGDWIARSGKHLKYIYSTHGHGDHWFGTKQLMDRFPGVTAYATPGTLALMHKQATEGRQKLFDRDFPGQLGETPVLAQVVPAGGFELEGKRVLPVEVGHSDTDDTTVLYVPSIGLVAAGDVAYNGVHQYLLEGGHGGFEGWLAAIAKVEALKPRIVIAGHKNKALPDDPKILGGTRQYLLDAQRLLAANPAPQAYYEQMLALYPNHLNRGPLWYSGVGLLAQQQATQEQAAKTAAAPTVR
ncbi:MAG: fold metallo-hydrolase [Betaproteobacteria bacterium]|nr:fold metallo-hydrolase [Betaproteobacteria bacterium]